MLTFAAWWGWCSVSVPCSTWPVPRVARLPRGSLVWVGTHPQRCRDRLIRTGQLQPRLSRVSTSWPSVNKIKTVSLVSFSFNASIWHCIVQQLRWLGCAWLPKWCAKKLLLKPSPIYTIWKVGQYYILSASLDEVQESTYLIITGPTLFINCTINRTHITMHHGWFA